MLSSERAVKPGAACLLVSNYGFFSSDSPGQALTAASDRTHPVEATSQ